MLAIFCITTSIPAAYQSAGIEMNAKAIVGKKIDDVAKQYIICQDINNSNIYYSFFATYKKQWFTNKSIIKEYKLYVIKVEKDKVVDFYEAPANAVTTDSINEIKPTTDMPSVRNRGWLSFIKEDFASFSPLG